jgi:hypothetical protein
MSTPFCDFCSCEDCQNGSPRLQHARTADGRQICDVCWQYEACMDEQVRRTGSHNGPCDDDCDHRPKLVTGWVDFEETP